MKKIIIAVALGFIVSRIPGPSFFSDSEFQGWEDKLNPRLRPALDRFRLLWGAPVHVSTARGAVGRNAGEENRSQHNVDYWGQVNAVDVFPEGMEFTEHDINRAIAIAESVGFTGIGVYLDTQRNGKPAVMMHVDVRDGERVATWSRIDGQFYAIENALSFVGGAA